MPCCGIWCRKLLQLCSKSVLWWQPKWLQLSATQLLCKSRAPAAAPPTLPSLRIPVASCRISSKRRTLIMTGKTRQQFVATAFDLTMLSYYCPSKRRTLRGQAKGKTKNFVVEDQLSQSSVRTASLVKVVFRPASRKVPRKKLTGK